MSDFLIYLSHPCMYVWKRMLELRTRPLLAWGCKARGVHCTKHVRVYVSAQKGY
jgi:hypothetical protein